MTISSDPVTYPELNISETVIDIDLIVTSPTFDGLTFDGESDFETNWWSTGITNCQILKYGVARSYCYRLKFITDLQNDKGKSDILDSLEPSFMD